MDRNELVSEIQNRLNLAIVVAILFAGVNADLYQVAGDAHKASQASLYLSADAGVYIATYVLFELLKRRMGLRSMRWLSILLLIGIGAFLFPLFVLCLEQNGIINIWLGVPLVATLWSLPITALANLGVMIVALYLK